jgi:hypothetical protein
MPARDSFLGQLLLSDQGRDKVRMATGDAFGPTATIDWTGMTAIAVAIPTDLMRSAIMVSGPEGRLTAASCKALLEPLASTATQMSLALGETVHRQQEVNAFSVRGVVHLASGNHFRTTQVDASTTDGSEGLASSTGVFPPRGAKRAELVAVP